MPAALDWSMPDSVANSTVRIRSVPCRSRIGSAAAAPIVTMSSSGAAKLIASCPSPVRYFCGGTPAASASSVRSTT